MVGRIILRRFKWYQSQGQNQPELPGIVETSGHSESMCCDTVFWSLGFGLCVCIVLGPIRGASRGSCTSLETLLVAATTSFGFGFWFRLICHWVVTVIGCEIPRCDLNHTSTIVTSIELHSLQGMMLYMTINLVIKNRKYITVNLLWQPTNLSCISHHTFDNHHRLRF
jgi:hypothetical protein